MVTFLITSVLLLGLFAIAIYLWQKPANSAKTTELPPLPEPRALFANDPQVMDSTNHEANGHKALFTRMADGDLNALCDARSFVIYDEVLNIAVSEATTQARLLSLLSHVERNELPVNRTLAEAVMQSWKTMPNRETTAKMLHAAALTNDAEFFGEVVELTLNFWRDGKLNDLTALELQALFNGEFWLLSSEVRSSGKGFVLKRTLSSAKRELEGTTTN